MMVRLYHPASNVVAERVEQTVKDELNNSKAGDFLMQVTLIPFQLKTITHKVIGHAPASSCYAG